MKRYMGNLSSEEFKTRLEIAAINGNKGFVPCAACRNLRVSCLESARQGRCALYHKYASKILR